MTAKKENGKKTDINEQYEDAVKELTETTIIVKSKKEKKDFYLTEAFKTKQMQVSKLLSQDQILSASAVTEASIEK